MNLFKISTIIMLFLIFLAITLTSFRINQANNIYLADLNDRGYRATAEILIAEWSLEACGSEENSVIDYNQFIFHCK